MKKRFNNRIFLMVLLSVLFITAFVSFRQDDRADEKKYITYIADTRTHDIVLYWKDDSAQPFRSIQNLKTHLEKKGRTLVFAMNGGMYRKDRSPQGLYIEEGKMHVSVDTGGGPGNFYMKPNGIFYITKDRKAGICITPEFRNSDNIRLATQSGPMLIINGSIHPAFREGSKNLNIRNGVGIMSDHKLVFVMSKTEVSFYEFARYFKDLGCRNALYLDGFVSRTYLPAKQWIQTDGSFGVIIGEAQ